MAQETADKLKRLVNARCTPCADGGWSPERCAAVIEWLTERLGAESPLPWPEWAATEDTPRLELLHNLARHASAAGWPEDLFGDAAERKAARSQRVRDRVAETFPELQESERNAIAEAIRHALEAEATAPTLPENLKEKDVKAARHLYQALADEESGATEYQGEPKEKKSLATVAAEIGLEMADRLILSGQETYVRFYNRDHYDLERARSRVFRKALGRAFYNRLGKTPGGQTLQDALSTIEAVASYDGEEEPVYTRVAPGEHVNEWWLDVGDRRRRAIRVSPDGWEVVENPPVNLVKTPGMLPLPEPDPAGHIDELADFVNVDHGSPDWILTIAWLTQTLRPHGPYPILGLLGEQGSAKSSTATTLGGLVDPTEADRQSLPRDEQALAIWAQHAWLIRIDNVSSVPAWLSDALARLTHGGGNLYRTLYSNAELTVFRAMRPILVNGITDFITRPDLLSRSIVLHLPPIPKEHRQEERILMDRFRAAAGRILGGLLNLMAEAAKYHPVESTEPLSRMADFHRWALAVERAAGWEPGTFTSAYEENQRAGSETVLQGNQVAMAIRHLIESRYLDEPFEGTATELLEELNSQADDATKRAKGWPTSPTHMGSILARVAPLLRDAGVSVSQSRDANHRVITLGKSRKSPVIPSSVVTPSFDYDSRDGNDSRDKGSANNSPPPPSESEGETVRHETPDDDPGARFEDDIPPGL